MNNNSQVSPNEPNKEMFYSRMNDVINVLKKHKVELDKLNSIELFGRGGDWHTVAYADKVKSLEVWEIDENWEYELRKNLPHAKIKIVDSIKMLRNSVDLPKFDLIMIDNPMNLYGPIVNGIPQYCEHFEVLEEISKLIDKNAIIVFNVNKKPFDYEQYLLWKKRREKFYGTFNTDDLSLDFLFEFYKNLFLKLGFETVFHECVRRHEYLDYFVYMIRKIE